MGTISLPWLRGLSGPVQEVEPPRPCPAGDVEAGELVIVTPEVDPGVSERLLVLCANVVRARGVTSFVDPFGLRVPVPHRHAVAVASRPQRILFEQKLGRAVDSMERELHPLGTVRHAVVGYRPVLGDPPGIELTRVAELLLVSVAPKDGGPPVLELRRDWLLLRGLEMERAPVASVMTSVNALRSWYLAAVLGRQLRRKSFGYLNARPGARRALRAG